MIYRNRAKEALQSSGVALGTFIQTASPESAEIAAACGFDYIILDMEHGSFGIDSLVNLIRAVQVGGSTPVVRLPDDSESGILKAQWSADDYTGMMYLKLAFTAADAELIRHGIASAFIGE